MVDLGYGVFALLGAILGAIIYHAGQQGKR